MGDNWISPSHAGCDVGTAAFVCVSTSPSLSILLAHKDVVRTSASMTFRRSQLLLSLLFVFVGSVDSYKTTTRRSRTKTFRATYGSSSLVDEALLVAQGEDGEGALRAKPVLLTSTDAQQHTALNLAAFRGNLRAVQALVRAGADVEHADEGQHRPLHHAVLGSASDAETAEMIRALSSGATTPNARAKDYRGIDALQYASGARGRTPKPRARSALDALL